MLLNQATLADFRMDDIISAHGRRRAGEGYSLFRGKALFLSAALP